MRQEILLLSEIQELELVIEESSILHRSDSSAKVVEDLRRRRNELRDQLQPELLERYDRMRSKGTAVVHEVDGVCTGCRLNVPKGDLQRMQNEKAYWICPNCSKFIKLNM